MVPVSILFLGEYYRVLVYQAVGPFPERHQGSVGWPRLALFSKRQANDKLKSWSILNYAYNITKHVRVF